MNRVPNQRTSVSTLLGAAIFKAEGGEFGRVREFAVAPLTDASKVEGFVVRAAGTAAEVAANVCAGNEPAAWRRWDGWSCRQARCSS